MFSIFIKKPLAVSAALFLSCMMVLSLYGCRYAALIGILLAIAALFFFAFALKVKKISRRRFLSLSAIFLLALSLAFSLAASFNQKRETIYNTYHEKELQGNFLVSSIARYGRVTQLEGVFLSLDDKTVDLGGFLVSFNPYIADEPTVRPGDIVSGHFSLEVTEGTSLSNKQTLADGYYLQGEVLYLDVVGQNKYHPTVLLHSLRDSVSENFEDTLTEDSAAMMKALLLADKSGIDASVKDGFSSLGIQHLFAVSGLHLSILIGTIASILAHYSVKRRIAFPILTVITLFYMLLTGFSPSMLRSGGMLLLFYFSHFSHRKRDAVTSLFTASAVIVILSPASIFDVGLLMSFLATLGILLIASPILTPLFQRPFFHQEKRLSGLLVKGLQSVISAFILSLAATAAILPILYLMKSKVVLITFIANLVFTPLFSLLLFTLPLFFLFLPFEFLTFYLSNAIDFLTRGVYSLALYGKRFSALSFSLDYPFMLILILILLTVLFLLLFTKRRPIWAVVAILVFFLSAQVGIQIAKNSLSHKETLYYHTNQKSDSILLFYETRGMMIDFSISSRFIMESFDYFAKESAAIKPDTLMLTTCRATHFSAIRTLIDRGEIKHLLLPKGSKNADIIYEFASEMGMDVRFYTPKDHVIWNDISIATYPDKTVYNVSCAEIKLTNTDVLYIKENAPTIFDIRFGPLEEHHDVLFYGGFGLKSRYGPYKFDAEQIVQSNNLTYFDENEDLSLVRGDFRIEDVTP